MTALPVSFVHLSAMYEVVFQFPEYRADFLSAGQCGVGNGGAFVSDAAVAGDRSTSNADRRICDFYDTAGGRRSGGRQNERSNFERTKRFVYSTVMIEPFQVSCRDAVN